MDRAALPPSSIEAEEQILGAMLVYEPAVRWAVDEVKLGPEDFYLDRHKAIYEEIARLRAAGTPCDTLIVTDALTASGEIDSAGGSNYVAELAEKVNAPGNAKHHARIVADLALERRRRNVGHGLADGSVSADEAVEELRNIGTRARSERLRLLDMASILDAPIDPVPWLVEGIVARGALTLLAAAPGTGKSYLTAAIGSAFAQGANDIAGLPIAGPGQFLYVDGEMGEREQRRRAHLLEVPRERFSVALGNGFNLCDAVDRSALAAAAKGHDIVCLDSLTGLAPGLEENDAEATGPVITALSQMAKENDQGVLLIHHTRKAGDTYRGTVALAAAADIVAILEVTGDDPSCRRLTWDAKRGGKMRLDEPPKDVHYRMETVGGAMTFTETDAPLAEEKPPTKREALAARIVEHLSQEGPAGLSDIARAIGEEPTNKTVRRALKEACEAGSIERLDDGLYCLVTPDDNLTDNPTIPFVTPDDNPDKPRLSGAGLSGCHSGRPLRAFPPPDNRQGQPASEETA